MSIKISYGVPPSSETQEKTLTTHQAIALLAGKDFWRTRDIAELELGSLKFTDGPNGARGEHWTEGKAAVCFPCATALGASFDRKLLHDIGKAIAVDALGKRANGLLAPTVNIHRYLLST
jgi:beta-glucosidase